MFFIKVFNFLQKKKYKKIIISTMKKKNLVYVRTHTSTQLNYTVIIAPAKEKKFKFIIFLDLV